MRYNERMKTYAERIKKARIYRGMTRTELGVAVGFPRSGAYRRILGYEKGERCPRLSLLGKFSEVLCIDLEWFCFDDDILIDNIDLFATMETNGEGGRQSRRSIEKNIYSALPLLTPAEIVKIIDIINRSPCDVRLCWEE